MFAVAATPTGLFNAATRADDWSRQMTDRRSLRTCAVRRFVAMVPVAIAAVLLAAVFVAAGLAGPALAQTSDGDTAGETAEAPGTGVRIINRTRQTRETPGEDGEADASEERGAGGSPARASRGSAAATASPYSPSTGSSRPLAGTPKSPPALPERKVGAARLDAEALARSTVRSDDPAVGRARFPARATAPRRQTASRQHCRRLVSGCDRGIRWACARFEDRCI